MNDTELLNALINNKWRVYKTIGSDNYTVYDYNDDVVGLGVTARQAIESATTQEGKQHAVSGRRRN